MFSQDTYRGWQWIQDHQDEFEKPVFGPPIVECAVKDLHYVDLIEGLFQRNVLLSFTVQTKGDFAKLSKILHDQLKLSEVNIKTMVEGLDRFRPTIPVEEMKSYGFDSWALDYLQGPDPVLAMLCAEMKLHETGVGLQDTTSQQYDSLQKSQLVSWVTKKSIYKITRRREYGAGATSTQVREVKPARVWTNQPVDVTAKREIEENIRSWDEELSDCRARFQDLKVQIVGYRDTVSTSKSEMVSIDQLDLRLD